MWGGGCDIIACWRHAYDGVFSQACAKLGGAR